MARHQHPEAIDDIDLEDSIEILDGDFARSSQCRHRDGEPCSGCEPVFRTVGAFDVPGIVADVRKLVARGRYVATRHRERRREGELVISEHRFDFTSLDGNGPRIVVIVED